MAVRLKLGAAVLAVMALVAPAVSAAAPATGYIVVLHDSAGASAATRGRAQLSLAQRHRVAIDSSFRWALNGFTTRLTVSQRARLALDPAVAALEADHFEQVLDGPAASTAGRGAPSVASGPIAAPARFVDDSLRRIGADAANPAGQNGIDDERPDVDIAILDSGIAPLPDLNIAGGYNCTGSNRGAYGDVYGHGTEVAAVTAALDNANGIVGVLPGARLWSVKMITNSGGTSTSMAICAVDWVAGRRDPADPGRPLIEVANMSFTIRAGAKSPVDDGNCGRTSGDLFHRAICRMTAAGTIGVAAAGNHGRKVGTNRPAAFSDVITVSAIADFDGRPGGLAPFDEACLPEARDEDDTFANFSNFGPAIDIAAPGVCMTMPWIPKGGVLHQQSGTSFAAPLVAGAAGMFLARNPDATPRQVRDALHLSATGRWFKSTDPDTRPDRLLNLLDLLAPDSSPPSASVPRASFATGRQSPLGKAPLLVRLAATDDRSTSFTFELQQQLDGGAWMTVAAGPSASVVRKVPLGVNVRFRVRATDGAGNTGAWAEAAALTARLVDTGSTNLLYEGPWKTVSQAAAFDGSTRRTGIAGSTAATGVWARAVAVAVTAGPDRGKGRLTVDGAGQKFDSLRSTSTARWLVAGASWAEDGQRQLTVTVLGTAGRPKVDFDAWLVLAAAP